jgi:hypothetical protein
MKMSKYTRLSHAVARFSPCRGLIIGLACLLFLPGTTPVPATASPPAYIVFRRETVDDHLRLNSAMVMGKDAFPQIAYEANGPTLAELNYARWTGSGWSMQSVANMDYGGAVNLAVDTNSDPHISFSACDMYYCQPRFADWTGSQWVITSTVEGAGPVAIDAANMPHMAYAYGNVVGSISLRHAYRQNNQWITTTLDSGLDNLPSVTIALNSQGYPQIAYYARGALNYTAWLGHSWTTQVVETQRNVGLAIALALDGADQPHLSYYDWVRGNLRHATRTATGWITETVDSGGDVGGITSLAIDRQDHPHIAYYDATHRGIKYARWTGTQWQIFVVDTAVGDDLPISLGLDAQDLPRIAYTSWDRVSTNSSLKLAWGEWAHYFPIMLTP